MSLKKLQEIILKETKGLTKDIKFIELKERLR